MNQGSGSIRERRPRPGRAEHRVAAGRPRIPNSPDATGSGNVHLARIADQTYPVLWEDARYGCQTAGRLSLNGNHALLAGLSDGEPRIVEFEAAEVAAVELVSGRERRLRDRPTVMVTLHNRGRVLIAEAVGIGIALEIADRLSGWIYL